MHLQKEANNSILLDKLNNNKHFAEVIKPIIEFSKFKNTLGASSYPALALAGGSLASVWNDTPVNDWDLYVVDMNLCNTPHSKKFLVIHILTFIVNNYPLSKMKVHSSDSKSEDKVDTFTISNFLKRGNCKLDSCGLISLEIITKNNESINAQLIFLDFKSFRKIFPPEKPIEYLCTKYEVDQSLFTQETFRLIDFNFTASNSRVKSSDIPFLISDNKEEMDSLSLDFYLYFSYSLDHSLWPLSTQHYRRKSIKRFLLCPSNLIQTYDFTCVSAYYFNDEVGCVDSFYTDNDNRNLVINPYHSNILNFHARVKKYSDRGYSIDANLLFKVLNKQYELLSSGAESSTVSSVIPISYYRKQRFCQEVKSIIDNFDSFEVNKKMDYFAI